MISPRCFRAVTPQAEVLGDALLLPGERHGPKLTSSHCCTTSRRSQSLLRIPHWLSCSGSFTPRICSGGQVLLLQTVNFRGLPFSGSQRGSQFSAAEQNPFIGPVFQATCICKRKCKPLYKVPEIRHLEQTASQASGQQ